MLSTFGGGMKTWALICMRTFTSATSCETTESEPYALVPGFASLPEGEAYYFRDWPGLIRHLTAMLVTGHQEPAGISSPRQMSRRLPLLQ